MTPYPHLPYLISYFFGLLDQFPPSFFLFSFSFYSRASGLSVETLAREVVWDTV